MKMLYVSVLAFFLFAGVSHAEVKQIRAESRITDVTLYRSQAMVVRNVAVPDAAGELAVEIKDLPPSIIPGTIFASSKDVKIISVRFLAEYVPVELPKDALLQIEKRLKEIDIAMKNLAIKRSLLDKKEEFLKQLELQYIAKLGPSATALTDKDVNICGFDFKTIAEMTEFVFSQRDASSARRIALDDEERSLKEEQKEQNEKLNALRHEFGLAMNQDNQAADSRLSARNTLRKAIVYIAKEKPDAASLAISYLVENASWNPAYNMRINSAGKELNLEYIAHVHQTTGEDWNGVRLTLSTATPSMNAEIPILAPMWIKLIASGAGGRDLSDTVYSTQSVEDNLLAKTWQAQTENASNFMLSKGKYANISFNESANKLQCVEFRNKKEVLKRWYEGVHKIEQQMAVEYAIPDTVTVASRNDNQMVQIISNTLSSSLYYEAVPLLAGFVSRGLEAFNAIDMPLLAGEYSAFVDGQYVGKGNLPLTATGQMMVLGFGIDPQLRCRRELLDKTAGRYWGERTETYKYRLTVDNYKPEPVSIRLLDRIPVTKDDGLKITLKEGKDQLSKDSEYQEFDLPKGILRWDVTLPASSSGSKAAKFDYSYDMEFDSDMQISAQGEEIQEQLRNDLFELEKRWQRK